jgi:hypothetical protein
MYPRILIVLLLLVLVHIQCKKEDLTFQQRLQGSWRLQYHYNGYGWEPLPSATLWVLKFTKDTLYNYSQDTLFVARPYYILDPIYNGVAVHIGEDEFHFASIHNDTLIMSTDFEHRDLGEKYSRY